METRSEIEVIASLACVVHDNPEPDQLASHIAHRVLGHLDCRAVAIGVIQKEGFLDLIGNYGLKEETTTPYRRMPLWSELPMTEAARTGEFIFLRSKEEIIRRFPKMVDSIEHEGVTTVAAPIRHRSTIIGSIAFSSTKTPVADFMDSPITEAALALVGLYIKIFMFSKPEAPQINGIAIKSLSERQRKIIKLFREELTTDQMADRLRFSSSTIKQDIIKIYNLFGVNSREQVVVLAELAGLLEPVKAS